MYSSEMLAGSSSTDQAKVPSIFVNESLLPNLPSSVYERFSVDVNSLKTCLEYYNGKKSDIETFRNFEVYSNMESATNVNVIGLEDRCLEFYIQDVPQGVVINSNIFLSQQNWNTLVPVSETSFNCAVCNVHCDKDHVKLDGHIVNLKKHKPLYRYDLSIVRKINNDYHCGVCNLIFQENTDHLTSEEHGDKMLTALNKVSDIMYDYNTHRQTDTYHYDARAINNVHASSDESASEFDYGNGDGEDYENEDNEDDEDEFYEDVEPLVPLEHSYASMAKKPKVDELPKVLKIDLGNKKVTVNYNSWNMVIYPKLNHFYCMVCTTFGHVRKQAEHCRSLEHVERLAKCKVVDMYEMYLVRQVDDKLYHCGHCNNLQLIHEMIDHIETQHPNKHAHTDSNPSTPKNKSKMTSTINDKENSKNTANLPLENTNVPKYNNNTVKSAAIGNLDIYHDLRQINSDMNGDIVICAYGKKIRVSKMAYNIVCARANDFYCGLCELSVDKERIKFHVNDIQHLTVLQRTPFIEVFNIHLFRQIRDALHCALCNDLIQIFPASIIGHKFQPKHVKLLQEATGAIAVPTTVKSGETANNEIKIPTTVNNGDTVTNKTVKEAVNSKIKVPTTVNSGDTVTKNTVKEAVNSKPNKINVKKTDNIPVPDKSEDTKANEAREEVAIAKVEANGVMEETEFIEVRNGVKEADYESEEVDEVEFDFEEHVHLKLDNLYFKISNTAYNSLVVVGDGTRYCFVCSLLVVSDLVKHVESRSHLENMDMCKFVKKYDEHLIRQIYLMYHCSVCNVLVSQKLLRQHLTWPTHCLQTKYTKVNAKQRKTDVRSGIKVYNKTTGNENIYLNEQETKVKIYLSVSIPKEKVVNFVKKNKIVIFDDNVLKISFDSWHSLETTDSGWKCKVCIGEFSEKDLPSHVTSDWHVKKLEKFEKKFSPALIRKINDTTLHCVMCNIEVSTKQRATLEHVSGKRHKKHFDAILKESSVANSYADCDENVLTL